MSRALRVRAGSCPCPLPASRPCSVGMSVSTRGTPRRGATPGFSAQGADAGIAVPSLHRQLSRRGLIVGVCKLCGAKFY